MLDDKHHLHDRLARIERRLDHIAYGGVVGLCVIAILIWLF
jgi:hypothetical protein